MTTDNWEKIPHGLFLMRMLHKRTGKHCLHLHLKLNDGPWYGQPEFPSAYSQEATEDTHREFWTWAEQNLPIWEYPNPV